MRSTIKGLFVNNSKAQDSIYESGLMVFRCLKLSEQYTLEYIEISPEQRNIPGGFNFYFFNYHPSTMPWLETRRLKQDLDGLVITMILEVLPGDPFVLCPRRDFDFYCALDPTLKSPQSNVFAFPRPLELATVKDYETKTIPVIGSFGFATKGKGFQHVVDSVNKEFDHAIVRINIPFGSFVPNSEEYSEKLAAICKSRAKAGIEVRVTHNYYTKSELIDWCSENTLNCFLYDRNMPGLAATTDQAIVSGRPLAISNNATFRHIRAYLPSYPNWSLRDSIGKSELLVAKMKAAWSPESFCSKFEDVLSKMPITPVTTVDGLITLSLKSNRPVDRITRKLKRQMKKVSVKSLRSYVASKFAREDEELL